MEFWLWWVVFGDWKEPFWAFGLKGWKSWVARWMKSRNIRCSRIWDWKLMEMMMGVLLFAFGFILWILSHSLFQSFNRFNFASLLLVFLLSWSCFHYHLNLEYPLLVDVDWLLCAFGTYDHMSYSHMSMTTVNIRIVFVRHLVVYVYAEFSFRCF